MTSHTIPIRIYYEDTDAGGIVYHANYVKFAERGRTEFLRHLGFENKSLFDREGILFVVRRMEIDYLAPARLDDLLDLETSIQAMKRTSFVMRQTIRRNGLDICDMNVVVVSINAEGRPTGLPTEIRTVFETFVEPNE